MSFVIRPMVHSSPFCLSLVGGGLEIAKARFAKWAAWRPRANPQRVAEGAQNQSAWPGCSPEVMSDFRDQAPRPVCEMSAGDQELFRESEAAKLKDMFSGELARDEAEARQLLTTKFKTERSVAREFIQNIDRGLAAGVG